MTKPNQLLLHSLVAKHATLAMDLDIAEGVGFDGIEASATKLRAFLDVGFSEAELAGLLQGVNIPGMGFLIDIERQGEARKELMREAEELFRLASVAGAKGVQVLTGPVNVEAVLRHRQGSPVDLYSGLLGRTLEEQISLTARNLAEIADLARSHGLLLYLEALSWTPLNTIERQLETIDRAERDNVRMVIDFWHCYTSGDTPDDVARLDKGIIYGIHVCDSLPFSGGIPNEVVLRDVPTGAGAIDLKLWADAVKATGYDGWWSCELFCRKQQQQNSYDVARELHALMSMLVAG
ncbi:sugar phosphate isomerase/epimerase [Sinorhizobium kostiense]|uniref:Sugar phosphate isomerase/epimerase n=1 Tax=Sinorhizobium kostiense TaxID=76747 RepID=A0ABS4R8A1_9HYPH|nr:sugar phosphate isomerase/epimerase family protein [Sinorhizobium kostiense]MBP2239118.1 sugar phosphate isomerase/epimerase [Sinorhizobium kostiense]